jgi:hypothetical protein
VHTNFLLESLKGRDHLVDLDVDGKILLKIYLRKREWECVGQIVLGAGSELL